MDVLEEGLRLMRETGKNIDTIAANLLAEYREKKKRIAGFGHRIHTSDPRTARLFSLAEELGVADEGVAMLTAIWKAFQDIGKDLPINVDGAIAALLIDLKMPRELANAFFIMARVPGLVAHIHEEQMRERPMRRIHPSDHTYDGPTPRDLL
jgi:citrate synthase